MMKKLLLICLIVIAFFSVNATISWGDCENDKGTIVKKEISLSKFDKIHLNGSSTVYLTTGKLQKVVIETTQNIIDILKTDVNNGEWHIGFEKCINVKNGVKIYVDIESINKLSVNGSGDIIGKNTIESEKLDLNVKGSGDMNLSVSTQKINAKIQGSGDIKISGKASTQNVVIQGSGDYTALDLKSENAEASINGSGDIAINVSQKITARINGSGDIVYTGNPSSVDKKVNGSGDITAK